MIFTMNDETPRSTGDLVRSIAESLSELIRSEVELAKLDFRLSVARLGAGGGLVAGAALFFLLSFAFALVALAFLLSIFMAPWAAALVVAFLLLVCAGILGWAGRERLRGVQFRPTAAIDGVKDDFEKIRDDLRTLKENRTDES